MSAESKVPDDKDRQIRFPLQLQTKVGRVIVKSLTDIFRAKTAVDGAFGNLDNYDEERERFSTLLIRTGIALFSDGETVTLDLSLVDVEGVNHIVIKSLRSYEAMRQSAPEMFRSRFIAEDPIHESRILALDTLNHTFSQTSGMNINKRYAHFLSRKVEKIRKKGTNR